MKTAVNSTYRNASFVLFLSIAINIFTSVAATAEGASESSEILLRGSLDSFVREYVNVSATPQAAGLRESRAFSADKLTVELSDSSSYVISIHRVIPKSGTGFFTTDFGVVEDTSTAVFFQGFARHVNSTGVSDEDIPLSAAMYVIEGVLTLSLHFTHGDNVMHVQLPVDEARAEHRTTMRMADVSELNKVRCGTKGHHLRQMRHAKHDHPADSPIVARANGRRVIELATDADAQWYSKYGGNSNNRILEIVNAVSAIYQRDLGMEVQVIKQNVWTNAGTQPYKSSDSNVLLDQFGNYTNANGHLGAADSYHLFTGKNLLEGTVGLAWMGVICSDPLYSFGLTQNYIDSMDHMITAHELGHSLNADHDESSPRSLMYPSIGAGQNFFSNFSKGEIMTYVNKFGNICMPGTNNPEPRAENPKFALSISFDNRKGVLNGKVARSGYTRGCSHALEWARDRNFRRVSVKGLRNGNFTSITFRSSAPKRIRAKRNEPNRAYVRVRAICNGVVYRSPGKAVGAPKSTSKKYVNLPSWISRVNRGMRVLQAR